MTLYEQVKLNRDDLDDGRLWICFYKNGRSWESDYFTSFLFDDPSEVDEYDNQRLEEIKQIDPNGLLFNGYESCFCTEYLSLKDLTRTIRNQYDDKVLTVTDYFNSSESIQ